MESSGSGKGTCTVLVVCNRMHGPMNGPPVQSWSPVVVHRWQLRHFLEASNVPWKLETEKTGTMNYTEENTLLHRM
jgi:hypothetical protein